MVFLCLFLGLACLWDYSFRRIPNFLQMMIFGFGILNSYMLGSWLQVLRYFATAAVVTAGLYVFFKLGMMGGGDVKLLAVCSGFFEGKKVLYFLLFGFIAGAVIGIIKMIVNKRILPRMKYLLKYLKSSGEGFAKRRAGPALYMRDREEKIKNGVALSGPMLISALLYWGGAY